MIAIELLMCMKRIRFVEEAIAERYPQGKMRCPTHLCVGQEAVAAGVGLALQSNDFAVGTHRSHGHYLGKGGNLNRMIAEMYGKTTGCSAGKGGSMHLIDKSAGFMGSTAIVGGTIPIGVGLGLSIQLHGTHQVSCVYLGDGATEEGVFLESLNFAALRKLPVLFICENNKYSVYSPLKVRQPDGRKIYKLAEAIGVPSDLGDGNDVVSVYHKVKSAIESIRNGNGPVFFEFSTYRWREHCGPNFDNDIGYRTEEEHTAWLKKDPIRNLETQLINQMVICEADIIDMEKTIQLDIKEAFDYARNSPFPDSMEAFTKLYKSK